MRIRKDLLEANLAVPLSNGEYLSEDLDYEVLKDIDDIDDEFNLPILVNGVWVRAVSVDFE